MVIFIVLILLGMQLNLEGVFSADITKWNCDTQDDCTPRYEQPIYIPEALFAEIEACK